MTSHTEFRHERGNDYPFFRALPIACALGLAGWVVLLTIAFGIYTLSR